MHLLFPHGVCVCLYSIRCTNSPSQIGNVSHSTDAMTTHVRGLKVCFLTHWRIQEPWEIRCDLFNSPSLELGDWCRMFVHMSLSQSPLRALGPGPCKRTSLFLSTAINMSWGAFGNTGTSESFCWPGHRATKVWKLLVLIHGLQEGCLSPEVDF